MDLVDKLFNISPLLGLAGLAVLFMGVVVGVLYKRNTKLSNKLTDQGETHTERLMKVMTEQAAQLQANNEKSREKDDRYNLVLTALNTTIKDMDPEQALVEVRTQIEAARADLSRIANNQIIVATQAGVPVAQLQFPKP